MRIWVLEMCIRDRPLNGLRTALKKISRSVNAAFSAVPVAKLEQQTAAAAVSANKAAKAQAKLASGTTKAAKAAKRSVDVYKRQLHSRPRSP